MLIRTNNRRDFLRLTAASPLMLPILNPGGRTLAAETRAPNDRPRLALIGCGGQGSGIASWASNYGDFVAVADVDANHAARAKESGNIGKGKAEVYGDYRKLLERNDIDAVLCGTPDHWHTKVCVDSMKSGRDIYCEKPLTLTIDEGKLLCDVTKSTGRVLQVGTQQRSDHNRVFLLAVAMIRGGRIGKVRKVWARINGAPGGGPFAKTQPPAELNWDMWLGQCPKVDYISERCHGNFRWWLEYSGGKLTDWGAHHVDIGQWAIGMENTGPTKFEVVKGVMGVPFEKGWPTQDDRYNTSTDFDVKCTFANGTELYITSDGENGVQFEGEYGNIFVTRDRIDLDGGAVAALYEKPVPMEELVALRYGKKIDGHMPNFIECCRDRGKPASDVWTHHRALTTCHLGNIALRLGNRTLNWDPEAQQIVGDAEANAWLTRPQRKGYEVTA